MKSKPAIFFIKLVVSLTLLGYLVSRMDYERLKLSLGDAVPLWLVVSMLILIGRNWIGAWRCRVLLQAKGLDASVSYAVVLYFTSQFFNIFLPTSLGGDVARGYYLGKKTGHRADAAATVIMERLLGFVALIMLVMIALPFCFMLVEDATILYVALSLCLAVLLFILALLSPRVTDFALSHRIRSLERLSGQVKALLNSLRSFEGRSRLVLALILSLGFQLVAAYTTYLLAIGLGQSIPLLYFFLIFPLVQIISMFPFTLSGLGVREGAFVYLFTLMGVDPQTGLSIGLLFFAQLLVLSIIGGMIYFLCHAADRAVPGVD
jgi:uncharacterized protein (TIRG00374 family)